MALGRWLAGLACICTAGSLAACATPDLSAWPFLAGSQPAAGTVPAPLEEAAAVRAGQAVESTVPEGDFEAMAGRFTSSDDTIRILTDQDFVDRDHLVAKLEGDQDVIDLMGALPLINDGGAVFLAETGSAGFRTAVHGASPHAPRWRRIEVRASGGRPETTLTCRDPGQLKNGGQPGYRSICIDRAEGVADVTVAQRVSGWFLIDRFPYSSDSLAGIRPGMMLSDMGAKTMNLMSFSHSRFRRTAGGWQFDSVSPTQLTHAEAAKQTVHIASVELVSDDRVLATTRSPYALQPSKNLRSLPRNQQVVLRVQASGADPWIFAEEGGSIYRLADDGTGPDQVAGDGVFAGLIRTPADSRRVHRLMVHVFAGHMLGNETEDDYDADTWIVPLRVD
ncbi:MAG: hypothetical protein FJZ01_08440 [Candidatus Sericytochromatia bacterium]|nr:hypothetical protein [Candidatus Tanganyikabacteria bacterium]